MYDIDMMYMYVVCVLERGECVIVLSLEGLSQKFEVRLIDLRIWVEKNIFFKNFI